jgi:geranylgeranyl diphosphate synthase type II
VTGTAAPVDVDEELARYASITVREIDRILPRDDPLDRSGLATLVRDYPSRSGKGIRPALVLASCQAFGGSIGEAVGPAVAIELLHNAFLIHDDLEDESAQRRGRPTLHRLHGNALAVNTGDALAVLALAPLMDQSRLGARLSGRVVDEVVTMAQLTTSGQGLELRWRRDNAIDLVPADYFDLILLKTCCYTTMYPLRIGALIGTQGLAEPEALERVSELGFYLGAAFQIRDDLLNLDGTTDRYGKEWLGDLLEGKRTLMLIHLLHAAGQQDRSWLRDYLSSPIEGRRIEDAERILELMRGHGCLEMANEWANAVAIAAGSAFERAFDGVPDSEHLRFLERLIPYMVERAR